MQAHLKSQHAKPPGGTTSKKQLRVIAALWIHEQIRKRVRHAIHGDSLDGEPQQYLRKSAQIIREGLESSQSWSILEKKLATVTYLSRFTILLLDNEDTRYILVADAHIYHRISKQYLCTDKFLSNVFAGMLHPAIKGSTARLIADLRENADGLDTCSRATYQFTRPCASMF
jgi:hypothetical protein